MNKTINPKIPENAPSFERDIVFSAMLLAAGSPFAWMMAYSRWRNTVHAGPAILMKSALDSAECFASGNPFTDHA